MPTWPTSTLHDSTKVDVLPDATLASRSAASATAVWLFPTAPVPDAAILLELAAAIAGATLKAAAAPVTVAIG